MTDRRLRVVQWATGNAGRPALRALIRHPLLELVGVHAHAAAKVGRDAGELAGVPERTGILATADAEALLALRPDCVSYMAVGETRPRDAVADLCRILEAGVDVVSTSLVSLVYPPFAHAGLRDALEKAALQGGATLYTSGIDPGFSGDVLPLSLLQLCERVDSVRTIELMNYGSYPDAGFTGEYFGFGKPLDFEAPLFRPGALRWGWGGMVRMVADALGVELDEIREAHERAPAPEAFATAMARVEEGTCAAVRFEVQGIAYGRPVVVAEHVNRLRDDIAPQWPQPLPGKGSGYRVVVEGVPRLACDLDLSGPDGDPNTGGITATAMRVINAIPAVCAARPGLVSTLDLPLFTARGLLRR
jgi:4-hydroxy-tetrahydrodipicolinate reductase